MVGALHEFAQLGAGVYPELNECIVQMGFHGVRRDVQPLCHCPVGGTLGDQVDDRELGVVRLSQPVLARGWATMRRCTPNRRNWRPTRRASASASWCR